MLKRRADQAFFCLLGAADLAATSICWLLAYFLRWTTGVVPPVNMTPPFWWCVRTLPIVLAAALTSYHVCGLYQLGRRWRLRQEMLVLLKAVALMTLLLLAAAFYIRNPYESRLAHGLFALLTVLALLAVRRGFGAYFRWRRGHGKPAGRAIIVGAGRVARSLADVLHGNNWLGLEPVGFVESGSYASSVVQPIGSIEGLPALVETYRADYVFIALPFNRYAEAQRVFELLADALVEIRLVPVLPNASAASLQINNLDGLPILSLQRSRHGFAQAAVKRVMDVVLSAFGLVVLAPLMALVAVAIKLYDRGPILYRQERMGLDGRRFWMLKFRSMRVDAEKETGPVWAKASDDRRTPLGKFLRETSLDELPQLFNVLRGEMSLVGPRPERPHFIAKFRQSIPRYMLRHTVKAGITGWAQVNGWRGNTSLRKRVQYDLYYVSHWSIWLDVRILFLTVFRAMWDKHAY